MSKEKDPFGGFDLFNPTSNLKTPDPSKIEEVVSEKSQKELDIETATKVDNLDIPGSFDEEKTEVKADKKAKTEEKTKTQPKATVKQDEKSTNVPEGNVETSNSDDKEDDSKEEFSFKPLITFLGEKGIVNLAEGELEKLSDNEDALEQVIGNTITSSISEGIEDWKGSYDDEVQELLKYVELGGKPKDFYDVYYGNTSFEKMKVDTEENQKFVIRQGLKLSGFEDAEIEDELKDYEDLGKLPIKAETHLKKLQIFEKGQKENLSKAQEKQQQVQIEANKQYWNNLKEELFKKEEIMGFKTSQKEKEQLWDFISTPDRKTGKTKLQEHNEKNKDSQYLYAKLAMNNWDITKLEREATTKVTSQLRKDLSKFTDSRQKMAGARDNRKEDDNSEVDPFAAFSKLKI